MEVEESNVLLKVRKNSSKCFYIVKTEKDEIRKLKDTSRKGKNPMKGRLTKWIKNNKSCWNEDLLILEMKKDPDVYSKYTFLPI